MRRTINITVFVAIVVFMLTAANVARAYDDDWVDDGYELKRTLPTQSIPPTPEPEPTPPSAVYGVEQWRPVVATHFPEPHVDAALSVMWCESRGYMYADNPVSSAAGLFQFIRSTWDWVAPNIGADTYDSGAVYDGPTNIAAAGWLWSTTGGWSHWVCQP